MLLLKEQDVVRLLSMKQAIEQVRLALTALGKGEAQNQPRRRLILPSKSVLHQMAASYGPYLGTKIYSTHPRHGAHFLVLLYDSETGAPLLMAEANHLGQIRTGAATGVATDRMAPIPVEAAALLGCGFQGETQLAAMVAGRPEAEYRLWNRTPERAESLALRWREKAKVRAVRSAQEELEGAGLVTTATSAGAPVFEDRWLAARVHINAIGSNQSARRELPGETVRRASLIAVDSREQALIEAGDLLLAIPPEEWDLAPIQELGDLLSHEGPLPQGVTIFKSNGLAVEDVAVAGFLYEQALAQGVAQQAQISL